MADHTIKFTAPTYELGKQDLVLEVAIDNKKQGELHISEVGVDWWPRGAKTNVRTKSWARLRDFMES